jgi:hypothetical protein
VTALLTNSRLKAYQGCPELHYFSYVLGYRRTGGDATLDFGSAFHKGMEFYWSDRPVPTDLLNDPFENARLNALLAGYQARWSDADERYYTLGIEEKFDVSLVHPITGMAHPHWRLSGKLDLRLADGTAVVLGEHKTAKEDITPGSTYWQRLELDTQILLYLYALQQLGMPASKVLYDVAGKPQNRPKQNERPDEFQARIMASIAESPNDYFQRGDLVRTQAQIDRAILDLWEFADRMLEDERKGWHPRNASHCFKYGRPCSFFSVCCGYDSLDGPNFVRLENVNPELCAV